MATHCTTWQHPATPCNTLQHPATHQSHSIATHHLLHCRRFLHHHVFYNCRALGHELMAYQHALHTRGHAHIIRVQQVFQWGVSAQLYVERFFFRHSLQNASIVHTGRNLQKLACCNTLQHTATHCNTLPKTTTHCNALQHTAALRAEIPFATQPPKGLFCAYYRNLRKPVHYNTLKHTRLHFAQRILFRHSLRKIFHTNTIKNPPKPALPKKILKSWRAAKSHRTATHCNTLHHIWKCGTAPARAAKVTLQHTALPKVSMLLDLTKISALSTVSVLQHIATTRCNTLQHASTRCNTLQHIATHCNILQHTWALWRIGGDQNIAL